MGERAEVIVRSTRKQPVEEAVRMVMSGLHWESTIPVGGKVVIKMNLSSIDTKTLHASNTDPRIIRTVCRVLQTRTPHITLVESNGQRFTGENAFSINHVRELAEELGVKVLNLSEDEQVISLDPLLRHCSLSRSLLEADAVVTLPCLKTHVMTTFTGALKNQFGCVSQYDRMLLHRDLDQVIPLVNRLIKPRLAIMDGVVGMDGRGPVSGRPQEVGVILGSTQLASLDATAMRLVHLDPSTCKHLVLASSQGLGPIDEADVHVDSDVEHSIPAFQHVGMDWAVRATVYMQRYPFFAHRILLNGPLFQAAKFTVKRLRTVGIVR